MPLGGARVPSIVPNHENRVTNTATSASEKATKVPSRGNAKANHGNNHSPYWGSRPCS